MMHRAIARGVTNTVRTMVRSGSLLGVSLSMLAACSISDLTGADRPSNIVSPEDAATKAGAIALYRGALTEFSKVYAGNLFNYTMINGVLSDEFMSTDAYNLRTSDALSEGTTGPFGGLSTARLNADRAINALRLYGADAPTSLHGEMHALKGFIYVMIAELYCSGVPFSTVTPDERVVLGVPLTTTQMFEAGIVQFDSAIALAGDSTRVRYLAMVGKGRALVNLARWAEAAEATADVTPNFVSNVNFGTSTSQVNNYWFIENSAFLVREGIANLEGGTGLPYSSAADPRLQLLARGNIGIATAYLPAKFVNAANTPIPLANGIEARLILAEAQFKANNASWLGTLNTLRTTVPGLSPLSDPGSDTARVSMIFRERAFWLFATGHRVGDMRRLIRQYQRPANTVFATGVNPLIFSGANVYGPNVNLEPPQSERNNPNYNGCFNRDA